ncbi:hypothetical protein KY284_008045 [Solanum tuberosum]|nr:hypothetical protein KY284_008045 [Solanum tuberosum]
MIKILVKGWVPKQPNAKVQEKARPSSKKLSKAALKFGNPTFDLNLFAQMLNAVYIILGEVPSDNIGFSGIH